MLRSRPGRHGGAGTSAGQRRLPRQQRRARARVHPNWTRATVAAIAIASASVMLPNDPGIAAQSKPTPSLKTLISQAKALSNQINTLSEQYDGLKIQLVQARAAAKTATQTADRDASELGLGQAQVGQLAAESYMSGSVDPTLQFISSRNPQAVVGRASIMLQLDQEKGTQVDALTTAENAARRARLTAEQQQAVVNRLVKKLQSKTNGIRARQNVLNGAMYSQAMATFSRTGQYPLIDVPGGNTVGEQALRWALTRRGYPYVWGAAGPKAFDCSGLVVWSYGMIGIHLDHFTGDLWNEGVHVSRSQLEPGDLLFFYDLDHVGIYIGGNEMVDAPDFGQDVMVQQIDWGAYNGAVRIV
ncbi:MAG TPA: C40 family peptidase [Streptosporangiaceae bacterium]|nr:C40 family peptidase [Streptosporangiaceae bacterium]